MTVVFAHTRSSTGTEYVVVSGLSQDRKVKVTPNARSGGMIVGRRGRSIDPREARSEIAAALGVKVVSWDALVAASGRLGARTRAPNGGVLPSKAPYARSDGERLDLSKAVAPGETITILVDVTEPRTVSAALARIPGIVVERRRLPVGDYVIPGVLTVERKSATDFDHSITLRDGRMFSQMGRMSAMPGLRAVVLEEPYASRRWPLEGLSGIVAEIAAVCGASVVPSLSPRHTALLVARLARFALGASSPARLARVPMPVDPRAAAIDVLSAFPGVSREVARALLDRFGSPRGAMTASHGELVLVPGLGPARASALVRAFDAAAPETVVGFDEPRSTPSASAADPAPRSKRRPRPAVARLDPALPSGATADLFSMLV